MGIKGRFTGASIDEFKVIAAFESLSEALSHMPPRGQICEFPRLQEAVSLIENAMIDLSRCGVDVVPRPTSPEETS